MEKNTHQQEKEKETVIITHPSHSLSTGTSQMPCCIRQAKYRLHSSISPLKKGDKVRVWETGAREGGLVGRIGRIARHERAWVTVVLDQAPLPPTHTVQLLKLHVSQLQLSRATCILRKLHFALSKASGDVPPRTIPSPFRSSGETYWNRPFMC